MKSELKTRGISLVELIISLFLLLLASSFLMGMYLSASAAPKRLEKGAQLEQLAALKMDEVILADLGSVPSSSSGTFSDFPAMSYSVTTQTASFDPDMLSVRVEARAEDGQRRYLVGLKPARAPVPPPPPPIITLFEHEPEDESPDPDPDPDPDSEEPPAFIDPPPVMNDSGCISCHGGDTPTAPAFNLESLAANAAAAGMDPVEYVIQSIESPGAYVVPGYGGGDSSPMAGSQVTLTSEEAAQIANWILSGGTSYDPPESGD